jgi:hypothetical protein
MSSRPPVYFVEWSSNGVVEWVYVFDFESVSCASVYLFLCKYLRAPLGDKIYGLVVEMSVSLYFEDVVCCGYGFAGHHVCVLLVCRSSSLGDTPP